MADFTLFDHDNGGEAGDVVATDLEEEVNVRVVVVE